LSTENGPENGSESKLNHCDLAGSGEMQLLAYSKLHKALACHPSLVGVVNFNAYW